MLPSKAKRVTAFLFILLASFGFVHAQTPVRQIILVQNSGWMLPFYQDSENRFRASVADFAGRVRPFGTELVVASFNQTSGENKSPLLQYKGGDIDAAVRAINSIQLARKVGGAYADTDFREALVTAITEYTPGKPAIIWVVTNNRNSPNNSPETAKKNKEFYDFLQQTPDIVRIVGYPQRLHVVSKTNQDYSANGLMFYGIGYGAAADLVLRQILESKRVFGQASVARLKPLNAEALTFVPTSVSTPDVSLRLSENDRKTLILSIPASSNASTARLNGKLRNDFYPYDIKTAIASVDSFGFKRGDGKDSLNVKLSGAGLLKIEAGGDSPALAIDLQIPPIPSMFDPEVIFGKGYRIAGVLRFKLTDQKLAVSPKFVNSMNELFPRDPLPDLFVPGENSKGSTTDQPLIIQVEYPTWPLLVLISAGLIGLSALVSAFMLLNRATKYKVTIDGHERTIALKAFGSAELRDIRGQRVGILKRGFGRPLATRDEKFESLLIRIQ